MRRVLSRSMAMPLLAAAAAITITIGGPAPSHAAFPAANGLIAFQADTGDGNRIYTVKPSGHGLRQVTPDRFDASTPDWSPDGQWIAFSKNECRVALIHPDGTGLRTIASQTPGGCETDPAFTPDGDHLVFERYDPSTEDDAVWIMGLDGGGRRRIGTGPDGGAATPEVSPDGRTVTFLDGTPDGLTAIFGIGIDGGSAWQVTPTLYGITFKHDWAPDGSHLVMSDNADNGDRPVNLLTIRPNGTGLRYLTDWQTPDMRALAGGYSPDGKWIVYRQESGTRSALMLIHPNGKGTRVVLPFSDFRPRFIDWGPATG
jgi:Tol biopolymer transport system component